MSPMESVGIIGQNYERVVESIQRTAQRFQRDPQGIMLVVVTKGHTIEAVRQVLDAGAAILGENYVDEAIQKISAIEIGRCEWHMIGHVQSRKAKLVSQYFNYVHSLDSLKLAKRINQYANKQGKVVPVLLEFNVSGEESKYGFPAWDRDHLMLVMDEIAQIVELPHIQLNGVMTMPPFPEIPEDSRPYFVKMRMLQAELSDRFPGCNWEQISMGMSGDYEVAIEEGATLLRIGTEIMGPRSF